MIYFPLAEAAIPALIVLAISAALSAAAYFLLKPDVRDDKGNTVDTELETLNDAQQGAILPLIIGRAKTGVLIGWVGDRKTLALATGPETTTGGKGSRKKTIPRPTVNIFVERGWHMICVGPARKIDRIWLDGSLIYDSANSGNYFFSTELTPANFPSGTWVYPSGTAGLFTAADLGTSDENLQTQLDTQAYYGGYLVGGLGVVEGLLNPWQAYFKIYWGETDQAVDTLLADSTRVGVASRWPHVCYLVWGGVRLGQAPRWPKVEVDVTCDPQVDAIGIDGLLTITENNLTAGDVVADGYTGPISALALSQLLFNSYPHGAGLDVGEFDYFEDPGVEVCGSLAQLCAQNYADGEVSHISVSDGGSAGSAIATLLQDLGCFWVKEFDSACRDGAHGFKLIREEAPVAVPAKALLSRNVEIEILHLEVAVDRAMFTFADADRLFRETVIVIDEDGQPQETTAPRGALIQLPTVIHYTKAAVVAERRSQEELGGRALFTLVAGRAARTLAPGTPITAPGVAVQLRVVEVEWDSDALETTLKCILDHYGAAATTYETPALPDNSYETGSTITPPDPNVAESFIELPEHVVGQGAVAILPLRLRSAQDVSAQIIHLSADGVTYTQVDSDAMVMAGGALTSAMTADDAWTLEDGPTFDAEGPDIADVSDYQSNTLFWRQGRQVAIIGEEIFFVRNIEALGGSSYQLHGLLRARFDTTRAAHAIGAKVFILSAQEIEEVYDSLIYPNATLYLKQQPTAALPVDLADVTATSKTIAGKGVVPMAPCALRVTGPVKGTDSYSTGEDIDLQWAWRSSQFAGTGAGHQPAGNAVGVSAAQGQFEIRFLTTGDVLKRAVLQSGVTYTYTNANLVTDFGSEVDIKVEVRNINGGYRSPAITKTIELV